MIEYFFFCLLVSCFCVGFHTVMCGRDMLLVPVANFLSTYLPEWITKPLFECVTCMSSFWTITIWLIFIRQEYWMLPFAMFVVAGLNGAIVSQINFDDEQSN